jgi:hypothetical protein
MPFETISYEPSGRVKEDAAPFTQQPTHVVVDRGGDVCTRHCVRGDWVIGGGR